ncbi:preprotein translocase subunit SecE [Mycoplasmopsis pullorum]|uniref:preprotein translocase subunit SecE n=1 Tax=Mycoplasmopsis pullorum TaxID=48003 RepID=UPI001119A2F5|nr:preprotein translocase subunit SecE [Mycoplasmopsis pullorum]TNK87708.1 preprotein translocase subunit SecE [Mycoplasmopsis pullorum]
MTLKKQENQKPKVKKYYFRKFIKVIKRVRWPDSKKNISSMTQIIVFTLIFVLFVFVVSTIFTLLWNNIQVGAGN